MCFLDDALTLLLSSRVAGLPVVGLCRFVRAKQMVALMAAVPRGFEVVLRTTLISAFLIVPCLFVKVQPLFENDY